MELLSRYQIKNLELKNKTTTTSIAEIFFFMILLHFSIIQ